MDYGFTATGDAAKQSGETQSDTRKTQFRIFKYVVWIISLEKLTLSPSLNKIFLNENEYYLQCHDTTSFYIFR